MIPTLISIVAAFIIGVITTLMSVNLSNKKSTELARQQKAEADSAAQESYLLNLRDELTINRSILQEIASYLKDVPPVVGIPMPAEVAARHLRYSAWDALVRAGVMAGLNRQDATLFRATDRAGRTAAEQTETVAALWRDYYATGRWKQEHSSTDGTRIVAQDPRQWIKEPVTRALERTDQSLARLNELLPKDEDRS